MMHRDPSNYCRYISAMLRYSRVSECDVHLLQITTTCNMLFLTVGVGCNIVLITQLQECITVM